MAVKVLFDGEGHLNGGHFCRTDTASLDDPNEISFAKGDILDIVNNTGRWWQAKRTDGTIGSELVVTRFAHLDELQLIFASRTL